MTRKIIALLTLAAFLVFEWACMAHTNRPMTQADISRLRAGDTSITGIVLRSGVEINFADPAEVRIAGDFVLVSTSTTQRAYSNLNIPDADIRSVEKDAKGAVRDIVTKDGKAYRVRSARREAESWTIEGTAYDVLVPISEIDLVHIRKISLIGTVLVATVGIVVALALFGGSSEPAPRTYPSNVQSCPFIYSDTGSGYVFDAEPYGGAIAEGVKRTEWSGLQSLKEVGGAYNLKVANEMDEVQYIDELTLLVADHPAGVLAVPEENGRVHTLARPLPPVRAVDGRGRDILRRVDRNDGIFWVTNTEEKDPDRKADLRDDLLFEFAKPAGARTAKLLFNGCSTFWASQMVRRFLELYGVDLEKRYAALNTPGPAQTWRESFNEREELYRLRVLVETPSGWVQKGSILGGGPLVSEDRVVLLDLAGVPGDVLRIKIRPPAEFWMINQLAVDYSPDLPVRTYEVEAGRAVDSAGRDIRPELAATDGKYFVMPVKGDRAELSYPAPPRIKGQERSVILKASGYYDIRPKAEGPMRSELLLRFAVEPGFVVQYSFREYLKWKTETLAALRR
jgi:hypothetical protein